MIVKDISFLTPQENILFDDVLLHLAEGGQGEEVLRFWESKELFIVLGRISRAEEDLFVEHIVEDDIPVLRRSSGGGTVLQGKGCLNYSLILSKDSHPAINDLRRSYQFILGKIISALKNTGIETVFLPISDIALVDNQKKISGNAQKRGKKFILHHGTVLYNFDLVKIERYLKLPKSVPEYRRGRSHKEFVTNVSAEGIKIKENIRRIFNAGHKNCPMSPEEQECLKRFLKTRNVMVDF